MGIDSVKCNDIFGLNNLLGRYINPHFVINSPHGLTQLIGYLKYHRELNGPVFFRVQNKDFFSMKPSLSREMVNFSTFKKAQEKCLRFILPKRI